MPHRDHFDLPPMQIGWIIGCIAGFAMIYVPNPIGRRIRAGWISREKARTLFPLVVPLLFANVVVCVAASAVLPPIATAMISTMAMFATLVISQALQYAARHWT